MPATHQPHPGRSSSHSSRPHGHGGAALRPADRTQLANQWRVSFRVRRLEPLLAWAIGGFAGWAALISLQPSLSAWVLALCAAGIGFWSRLLPAQHQGAMLARAVLLLAGALLLAPQPGLGGVAGPDFFWLLLVLGFYGLLLATPWALGLALLGVLAYGLSRAFSPEPAPWNVLALQGGFVLLLSGLAIEFGRTLRVSDEQDEAAQRDARSMLYNRAGFFGYGAVLLAQCRRNQQPLSMVLLSGRDLRDIPELLGHKAANALFDQAVRAMEQVQGNGIAARLDALEFALLLPDTRADRAAALVQRRMGHPPRLEIQFEGKPVVIVLDMEVGQAQDKGQSLEELFEALRAQRARHQAEIAAVRPALLAEDGEEGAQGAAAPARHRRSTSPTVPLPLPAHLRMNKPTDKRA